MLEMVGEARINAGGESNAKGRKEKLIKKYCLQKERERESGSEMV